LLKATEDSSAQVRASAFKRLGDLGGANELLPLLNLMVSLGSAAEKEAAEQALAAIFTRLDLAQAANKTAAEQFLAQAQKTLASAQPPLQAALLRLLSLSESAQSLDLMRQALKDPASEVRATAIRSLSKWKSADVSADLLSVAKTAPQPNERTLGLRGYLTAAANPDLSASHRLEMCKEAVSLIQRDEEKKMLLAALGTIPTLESLNMVVPQMGDQATREEACNAVVAISSKLLQEKEPAMLAPKLIDPLQKVADANLNAELTRQAKGLLQQAQSKIGK
jgi:HEAT repeat protein